MPLEKLKARLLANPEVKAEYDALARQQPLTPLAGSGRRLWSKSSTRTLGKLRDEWSR